MQSERIQQLILDTCAVNGVRELAEEITFSWSTRMTAAAGKAYPRSNRIKLSTPIFAAMSEAERVNTVVHEACHLVALRKYGNRISAHGHEWKTCMIRAGETPTRCHTTDLGIQRARSNSVAFTCGCAERVHYLGPKRAARMDATGYIPGSRAAFRCTICKQGLQKK